MHRVIRQELVEIRESWVEISVGGLSVPIDVANVIGIPMRKWTQTVSALIGEI
jgi:hypothetical protein